MLPPALLEFSISEWRVGHAVRIEDAYKWLFQATLGGEHAISSPDEARSWMDGEWSTLGTPHPHEPMTVQLRPDGRLLRVNLRPYKASGGSKDALLAVFVSSAHDFHADKRVFIREWKALGARLRIRALPGITVSDWTRLDRLTRPSYPAIEHSETNLKLEQPAYRVVEAKYWLPLRRNLRIKRSPIVADPSERGDPVTARPRRPATRRS